ncbi:MAG: hypothetical protein MJZ30_12390 [Paludibacteraceae bacterium]|nr:hypothetical protein [Paludibacteraceae bacterium]
MEAKEIIEAMLEHEQLSPAEFARKVGMRAQQISEYKSGKVKKISNKVAMSINNTFPHYNLSWLLTGEGSMLKKKYEIEEEDGLFGGNEYIELRKENEALQKRLDELQVLLAKKEAQLDSLFTLLNELKQKQK